MNTNIPPINPVVGINLDTYDTNEFNKPPEKTITLTTKELETKLEIATSKKFKEIVRDLEAQGYQLAKGINGRYQVRPWED